MPDIKPKPEPAIVERPDESVIIQIHYFKRRGTKGKLKEQKSKSLTFRNLSLDEAYQRIRAALSRS